MKRITALGVTAAITLAALAVLATTIHRLDRRSTQWADAEARLISLRLADSDLDRRVLRARGGLLRNYDLLASQQALLWDEVDRLEATTRVDQRLHGVMIRLRDAVALKEGRIERFKSNNALLTNSLHYFRISAADYHQRNASPSSNEHSSFIAAVQRLTLDTSTEATTDARRKLDALARMPGPRGTHDQLMLDHGKLLYEVLPQMDAILGRVHPLATDAAFLDLQIALETRREATTGLAALVRNVLFLLTGLLLVIVLWLSRLQSRRTAMLRRRKAFDNIMMGVSARLAAGSRAEIDRDVESALLQIAAWACAGSGWLWHLGDDDTPAIWGSTADARGSTVMSAMVSGALADPQRTGAHVAPVPASLQTDGPWILFAVSRHTAGRADAVLALIARPDDAPTLHPWTAQLRMAMGVLADAIERRRLEDSARQLERRLERARRMETVGAMASGVAHNFNNIIGAIQGNAELAQHKHARASQPNVQLREILLACVRARDLVGSILRLGRTGPVEKSHLSVTALVQETVSLLRASFGQDLVIHVHDRAHDARVAGSPADLQQVLMNIITNAGHAIDWKGEVTLAIDVTCEAVQRPVRGHRRRVRISITDNGPGIPSELVERIFEPFFTTRLGGTGLGLSTARQIVADHGGDLTIASAGKGGTVFAISLPLQEAVVTGWPAGPDSTGTMLVVGRDNASVSRYEDLLAALGWEPVGCVGPATGLRLASADPKRFDAALIDLPTLPVALACASDLHRSLHGAPLILAYAAGPLDPERLAECGVVDVVSQPPGTVELARAVGRSRFAAGMETHPSVTGRNTARIDETPQ